MVLSNPPTSICAMKKKLYRLEEEEEEEIYLAQHNHNEHDNIQD